MIIIDYSSVQRRHFYILYQGVCSVCMFTVHDHTNPWGRLSWYLQSPGWQPTLHVAWYLISGTSIEIMSYQCDTEANASTTISFSNFLSLLKVKICEKYSNSFQYRVLYHLFRWNIDRLTVCNWSVCKFVKAGCKIYLEQQTLIENLVSWFTISECLRKLVPIYMCVCVCVCVYMIDTSSGIWVHYLIFKSLVHSRQIALQEKMFYLLFRIVEDKIYQNENWRWTDKDDRSLCCSFSSWWQYNVTYHARGVVKLKLVKVISS